MRHNVRCVGQGVGVAQLVAVDVSGEPRSWTELGSDHLPVGGVVEEFLDELTPRWTGPPVADARDDYRDGAAPDGTSPTPTTAAARRAAALRAAAQAKQPAAVDRAEAGLRAMLKNGQPIEFRALARIAGDSPSTSFTTMTSCAAASSSFAASRSTSTARTPPPRPATAPSSAASPPSSALSADGASKRSGFCASSSPPPTGNRSGSDDTPRRVRDPSTELRPMRSVDQPFHPPQKRDVIS